MRCAPIAKTFSWVWEELMRYAKAVRHLDPMKKSGICKFIACSLTTLSADL
jgi:hypothetical protein